MMNRKSLRKSRLVARDQLKSALRREKSEHILSLLAENSAIIAAQHLFIYVYFRSEVETMELIEWFILTGKKISVPVTLLKESSVSAGSCHLFSSAIDPKYLVCLIKVNIKLD